MLNLATHWPLQFGPYSVTGGSYTQAGSGDPSPANIRAITPWKANGASTTVVRTGKNLLKNISPGSFTISGVTYTVQSNGSVVLSGSPTASSELYLSSSMELLPGSYVLSATGEAKITLVIKTLNNLSVAVGALTPKPFVVTEKLVVNVRIYCNSDATGFPLTVYPQIEPGSTATAYEPYISKSATLAAPELYAGYMGDDWYWRRTVPNLLLNGTETWDDTNFAASGYFKTTVTAAHATPGLACSHFLPATSAAADSNKIIVSGTSLEVYPADAVATDKAGWLAWLASNNTRVAYQLATPVSIAPTIP